MPPAPSADWEQILVGVWSAGQERSMVGPGDPAIHLAHAREMADRLDAPTRALDLGSGAGIPGLALAGLWPESRWTLVDAALRRVSLLAEGVAALGWADRVTVLHARAEELAHEAEHRGQYDLVTSRLFGPPALAVECAVGFLRVGGSMAITEPPGEGDGRWDAAALGAVGLDTADAGPGMRRFTLTAVVDGRYPRRPAAMKRQPLF